MTDSADNPYRTPRAKLASGEAAPSRAKMYSPRQIRFGAFLFGPLAAVWFLKSNFDSMEMPEQSRMAVIWGIAACALLAGIVLVLPDKFPRIVLPLAYAYVAGYFAEAYQLKKSAILESERYTFQSNWRVVGIGIITFVVFVAVLMGLVFGLAAMGVIHLE